MEITILNKNPYTGISYGSEEERGYVTEKVGVPYLKFPSFDRFPELRHGYSTRLGGVSTGHCASMSFSVKCGDTMEQALENFRRMSQAVGVSSDTLILTDQVHGNVVLSVGRENIYDKRGHSTLQEVDGIVTNERGVTLVCFTADCVPLFFYDPVRTAIGVSHAGWRGTVSQIGRNTLKVMEEQYGTKAEDVFVVIGPSICVSCYEVDEMVARPFQTCYPAEVITHFLIPKSPGHYQLDLWQANKESLLAAGVPKERISISGICTCCNQKLLHSHRATSGKRGILAGFLSLA